MDKSTNKTSQIAAWIIYIVNFIILVICAILFLFGIWIIASPATLSGAVEATGSATLKALVQEALTLRVGVAVVAVAMLIYFVSFMGIYGAVTRSPFMLLMYAALVLLFLLLECALLYYFSRNLMEKGLQHDGQWTHGTRLIFRCCENSSTPIFEERELPWSCCGPQTYPNNCTATLIFKDDCKTVIMAWLMKYQSVIYSSLSVFHIILASCSILRRSCSSSISRS